MFSWEVGSSPGWPSLAMAPPATGLQSIPLIPVRHVSMYSGSRMLYFVLETNNHTIYSIYSVN